MSTRVVFAARPLDSFVKQLLSPRALVERAPRAQHDRLVAEAAAWLDRWRVIASRRGCCTKPSKKMRGELAEAHTRAAVRADVATKARFPPDGMAVL